MIRFVWGKMKDPFFQDAAQLRTQVFMEEQGFSYDLSESDKISDHVVAYNEIDEPIAAARIFEEEDHIFHPGRICVKKEFRGQNIGNALMKEIERHSISKGAIKLRLGAQRSAEGFYTSVGYHAVGDPFDEEGCPHIWMEKNLFSVNLTETYQKIGVICAMDVESAAILPHIQDCQSIEYADHLFYTGTIHTTQIVLATSGIGKVQAACTTQLLIDRFCVDCVINSGIAGAIDPSLKTCDIVIADQLVYHDYATPDPVLDPFVPNSLLAKKLFDLCQTEFLQSSTTCYMGTIATGDQFIQSTSEKNRIQNLCDPLCVEMEGAAIGNCCSMNQVDFAVIRAISDSADENADHSFEQLKDLTSHIAAQVLVGYIRSL